LIESVAGLGCTVPASLFGGSTDKNALER
jgi:hypothetical protein